MRYIFLLMLIFLSACSVNKSITKNNIQPINQDKQDFEALVAQYKVFQKESLNTRDSSSKDVKEYFKQVTEKIKVFSKQADTLKSEFEGVLSSGTDLVNVLSLAYVSMIYYKFYKEVAGIKASPTFDEKAVQYFTAKMQEQAKPLLIRAQHAQIIFRKICIRSKLIDQCNEFKRNHQSELPLPSQKTKTEG